MAYLSVPKIFRHLTFLHLSSPFIVDNCSHISNLSFAITYVRSFLQISQPVLTAPAAHLSVQVHFSGSAGGSGSVGVSGSVGCSGSVDVSGAFPMHCARSDWQTAQSGFTAPSWHRTVQIQAAGSPAGGAVHKSISAAQVGHSVL